MLTRPDFIEKKLVHIGNYDPKVPNDLKFSNGTIQLYKNGRKIDQISCHLVFSICIIGQTTITSKLIEKLQQFGISLCLLNYNLKPYALINSAAEGNYLLREKQYVVTQQRMDEIAKSLVINKINNQNALLNQYGHTVDVLSLLPQIVDANNKQLLGIEGTASKRYFQALFRDLSWLKRSPRTKEDINNLLLDIGYTYLFNYVDALLSLFGFDTYKGYYHQLFFQRKSLTCDVMEPLRPMIDKQLVKAFNLKQINEKDFVFENGSFRFAEFSLADKYTLLFLRCLMEKREDIFQYVRNFYLHVLDPEKYPYKPVFIL